MGTENTTCSKSGAITGSGRTLAGGLTRGSFFRSTSRGKLAGASRLSVRVLASNEQAQTAALVLGHTETGGRVTEPQNSDSATCVAGRTLS